MVEAADNICCLLCCHHFCLWCFILFMRKRFVFFFLWFILLKSIAHPENQHQMPFLIRSERIFFDFPTVDFFDKNHFFLKNITTEKNLIIILSILAFSVCKLTQLLVTECLLHPFCLIVSIYPIIKPASFFFFFINKFNK